MIFYFTTTNGNSGATIASSKSHVTGGNRVAGTSIPNVTDSLLFHPSHTPCTTRRARTHGRAHTRSHTRTHTTTDVAQFQPEAEGTFRRTHTSPFEARDAPARAPTHTHASAESARYAGRAHTRFRHTRLLRTLGRESSQTHTHEQKLALSLFSLSLHHAVYRTSCLHSVVLSLFFSRVTYTSALLFCFVSLLDVYSFFSPCTTIITDNRFESSSSIFFPSNESSFLFDHTFGA